MKLAYAAFGSVVFAALFALFTLLRESPEWPCPWDQIIHASRQPDFLVTNTHPPPPGAPATEPLADCVSVLRSTSASGGPAWPDNIIYGMRLEAAALGLSVVALETRDGAPDDAVVAYTTFCAHRAEMTARLITAVDRMFPDGPRPIDVTDQVDTTTISLRQALPLWPGSMAEAGQ